MADSYVWESLEENIGSAITYGNCAAECMRLEGPYLPTDANYDEDAYSFARKAFHFAAIARSRVAVIACSMLRESL